VDFYYCSELVCMFWLLVSEAPYWRGVVHFLRSWMEFLIDKIKF
jgi:hypothetical protein